MSIKERPEATIRSDEMSDTNPFGSLGGEGGFDLNAMLEQAQQMQSQLVAAQEELAATVVEGSAGGVTVKLTGTGELTDVTVTPGSFDGTDADSLTDLGDLVVAAYRDGKAKVDELASRALGPLAGGGFGDDSPGLPGGFGV
jgi:DNA-binding YbaB/EbfC family protein